MNLMGKLFRPLMGAILFLMAGGWVLPVPLLAALDIQPVNKHSTLIDENKAEIRDDAFAKLMTDNLLVNGSSNVKDAKFMFQECFGGGMLDDLSTAFGTKINWVGGSASRWDQPSVGQVSTAENAIEKWNPKFVSDPPQDYWTKALIPQLNTNNQKVLTSIDNAGANDMAAKPNGSVVKAENPQSISANGGDQITLQDPSAASHHAILWAGYADHLRHFSDIDNMITTLKTQWAGTIFTISVLYGDGMHETIKGPDMNVALPASWNQGGSTVQAGTLANLMTTVQNVAKNLSPTEQFLFFASDHGGKQTVLTPANAVVPGNSHDIEHFDLTDGELQGLHLQQYAGVTPPTPSLTIDYSGLTTAATVTLNGVLLGSLDPSQITANFQLPENILLADNIIDIFNPGSSFTIQDKIFDTSGIDTNPTEPVPVPPSVLLMGSGLLGLVCWRSFRKS